MRLEKIQDHISLLDNLNKGDILIFSKNEFADDIKIMPDNIYWVNYRNNTVVSLKSFNKGEKKFDYNVVKPGAIAALSKYEKSLQAWIFAK